MSEQRIISAVATGGRGFVFEDEVAAYFLSCMLTGKPVFGTWSRCVLRRNQTEISRHLTVNNKI